jgi:hypothetical protein
VLARSSQPNHAIHSLLSFGTLGLWLPVWLLVALRADARFLCPECGGPTLPRPPRAKRSKKSSAADDED